MCMYDVIKLHNSNSINQNFYSVTEFSSLILKFHVKINIILQCFADNSLLYFILKRKKLLEFLAMHIHKFMYSYFC